MRSYWLKIILGACAVFLVGFAGVTAIRKSKDRIRSIAETSDPVSIPLAFLHFTLDGEKAGTFKGIRLDRDAPKSLNGITLRITLDDSADPARIQGCLITLEGNGHDFDPTRGFRCLKPEEADSALVPFGQVRFSLRNGDEFTVPLMLDSAAVADMRESDDAGIEAAVGADAEARAEAAAARADSITRAVQKQVDSIVRNVVPPRPARKPTTGNPG